MHNNTFRVIIEGTPPSVNHMYGNISSGKGRVVRFKTKEAKEYQKRLGKEFLKKYPNHTPFSQKCEVLIRVYYGDKRKRDIDNVGKAVLDSLNKLVYEDDNQITRLIMEKEYDKGKPRTEVIIELR